MSFSEFFISRPIFAGVISIIITIAGLIASQVLPIAQYPEIAPPTVVITANYPGASAETLARTVAAPIEEQLSGVENLIYYSSTASTNGALTINCTFEVGSNADKAVIDVNNRVAIALPRLPDVVRQSGVVAQKRSTDILLVIALTSNDPADFGNIVLRANGPNGTLRLRDVARVELGAVSYDAFTNLDGKPALGIAVYLQSGGNALKVADSVRAGIERLSKDFPQGVSQIIPFDTTRFVQSSIHEVIITLLEAAALVLLVVFVFLQNWRATLIPIIAVPVSLIGAFAGLLLFGFTINTLTLFAIVLATGIVVDDAIVVLENVERLMAERKLSPREAAIQSMREVTGAIVAIELVLAAVFIPVAFLGGIAGKLYQQFAVTVVTAVTISGIIALTLTPALCALLLKPQHVEHGIFRPFNRGFAWLTDRYVSWVGRTIRHTVISLIAFAALAGAVALLLRVVPTSFV